ncbi:RimK/LysX family protein [Tenacibaculum tangerinum]|uniref:RimK/LysX family protein n=1 Tax=Tenacibaculum tangerinum TaxID=3038772 RepID=A0ABY8L062_9FLAO|nr:RimK/LysX family protein [Tenacibaculum tangerinum]WGH74674.1 RimK/LysX family protein [Tenacibaculum tangerinum]
MKLIGRVEKISFLRWDIEDLPAKIDTGAYTSAIHCKHIEENDGLLSFILLCPKTEKYNNKLLQTTNYEVKKIRSSNGKKQKRYVVSTSAVFYDKKYKIKLSLSDRGKMNYPVLIGRKFLNKKFIVDVSQKNIASKEIKK